MGRARQLASKGNNFSLTLDSTDFNALLLNRTDLSVNDAGDNVLLDGTDGSATDAGFRVELETQTTASETDTNIGERLVLNGTNGASLDVGFSILQEDATDNADVRITSQLDNGVFNFTSAPKNDNNPAFYVTTLTNDVNAENTYSKMVLDVVHFDTINGWDLTNYRYKPTVSGYYHLYAQWSEVSASDVQDLIIGFSKGNSTTDAAASIGAGFGRKRLIFTDFDWYASTTFAETVIFMNGDDEYVQVYVYGYSENGATVTLYGDGRSTFFGGHLVSRHDSTGNWNYSSTAKYYEY